MRRICAANDHWRDTLALDRVATETPSETAVIQRQRAFNRLFSRPWTHKRTRRLGCVESICSLLTCSGSGAILLQSSTKHCQWLSPVIYMTTPLSSPPYLRCTRKSYLLNTCARHWACNTNKTQAGVLGGNAKNVMLADVCHWFACSDNLARSWCRNYVT